MSEFLPKTNGIFIDRLAQDPWGYSNNSPRNPDVTADPIASGEYQIIEGVGAPDGALKRYYAELCQRGLSDADIQAELNAFIQCNIG